MQKEVFIIREKNSIHAMTMNGFSKERIAELKLTFENLGIPNYLVQFFPAKEYVYTISFMPRSREDKEKYYNKFLLAFLPDML